MFANCSEAIEATGAKASVVFVPPRFAKDAVVEAIEAGIELIVVITEGIPVADSAYFVELALRKGVRIVGPNCPGLLTLPSSKDAKGCNLGIIPDGIVSRGPLGLVSKSGTLTYQLMGELSDIRFHPHALARAAIRSSARPCRRLWKPLRTMKPPKPLS